MQIVGCIEVFCVGGGYFFEQNLLGGHHVSRRDLDSLAATKFCRRRNTTLPQYGALHLGIPFNLSTLVRDLTHPSFMSLCAPWSKLHHRILVPQIVS
jgi:hypothetical protein